MNAVASTVAICVMGAISYLFCLVFPPLKEVAPVIAALSTLAFGAAGAYLWQNSVASTMSPFEWFVCGVALGGFSLVIFLANCWSIGLSPAEALFSFPKQIWDSIKFGEQPLAWRGLRYSLALAVGSAVFGIGSCVRWGILELKREPPTTRSTRTARKQAAG